MRIESGGLTVAEPEQGSSYTYLHSEVADNTLDKTRRVCLPNYEEGFALEDAPTSALILRQLVHFGEQWMWEQRNEKGSTSITSYKCALPMGRFTTAKMLTMYGILEEVRDSRILTSHYTTRSSSLSKKHQDRSWPPFKR